ncbi:MAG: hypothetical protein GY757_45170, partial [bacterium]|nr:hypothetical protein [bacterium]
MKAGGLRSSFIDKFKEMEKSKEKKLKRILTAEQAKMYKDIREMREKAMARQAEAREEAMKEGR